VSNLPKIVAILNISEDSFSDGGRYLDPEAALAHAHRLIADGTNIIELGPASSHPDAEHVPAAVQIDRLRPVLEGLESNVMPISIDATDSDVLRFAIDADVSFLNDVRGFGDQSLYPELASARASLVVVHSLLGQERATRDAANVEAVLDSVDRFFDKRLDELVRAGISEERLIIDPGMGFFLGSNEVASIAVLRRIEYLKVRYARPVFISVSRKSFLRKISGSPTEQIGAASLAAELYAAAHGAGYLRTHEPRPLRDALAIQQALES
jgi:dihydropteroate synthase type 2